MSKTKPVSFRLPSKQLMFLDYLAAEKGCNRTAVLVKLIDLNLRMHLSKQQGKGDE